MPKKGNVKKNISKQVKKPKNKEGGGITDMLFKKSHEIVIDCDNIINLIKNNYYFDWINEYKEYMEKTKSNTLYENIEFENSKKEYYIDTWLSKIILDVLQKYSNDFESIIYVGKHNVTFDFINYPNFFCFSLTQTNVTPTPTIIEKNSDIKNISINDLNTFSTTITENRIASQGDRGKQTTFTTISFPKILIFKLTLKTRNFFNNNNIQKKINEEIIENFYLNIQELNEHYLKLKDEIKNMINKREKEKEEKEERRKEEYKEQESNKIRMSKYLNNYFNENNLENNLDWTNFVNYDFYNLSKIDFLNHITKIIDELKKCKGQTDEEDVGQIGDRTNKKRPKKEILGKIMVIYKINGDRKEYVRHKGKLITIKDYKELMKAKKAKKLTLNSKKK